jgi:hypothetical protein
MSEALRLADQHAKWSSVDCMDAASELRRLAGVEAELQQAREERTALLVNEQNLTEELALVNEMNDQLREQNTAVDAACAKYEQELAALRASLGEPVAWMMCWTNHSPSFTTDKSDYVSWHLGSKVPSYPDGLVPLFAIKDTK